MSSQPPGRLRQLLPKLEADAQQPPSLGFFDVPEFVVEWGDLALLLDLLAALPGPLADMFGSSLVKGALTLSPHTLDLFL